MSLWKSLESCCNFFFLHFKLFGSGGDQGMQGNLVSPRPGFVLRLCPWSVTFQDFVTVEHKFVTLNHVGGDWK